MTKLYDLTGDYARLSESSDFTAEEIADTLEAIEGSIEDKVESILKAIKNEEAYAEALSKEADAFNRRARIALSKSKAMKEYIVSALSAASITKLRAGTQQVTVIKPKDSVKIVDLDKLPVELVDYETIIKPHTLDIKKKLQAGEKIEGAELHTGKPALLIK